jgi:hypothetical protein
MSLDVARGLIASDRRIHASIIDACRLAGASQCKTIVYSHSDAYDAERVVRETRSSIKGDVAGQGKDGSQTVVVTDDIWDRGSAVLLVLCTGISMFRAARCRSSSHSADSSISRLVSSMDLLPITGGYQLGRCICGLGIRYGTVASLRCWSSRVQAVA